LQVKDRDTETCVVRRTATTPVRSIKPTGRGRSPQFPRPCVAHQLADMRRTSVVGSQARQVRRCALCATAVRQAHPAVRRSPP